MKNSCVVVSKAARAEPRDICKGKIQKMRTDNNSEEQLIKECGKCASKDNIPLTFRCHPSRLCAVKNDSFSWILLKNIEAKCLKELEEWYMLNVWCSLERLTGNLAIVTFYRFLDAHKKKRGGGWLYVLPALLTSHRVSLQLGDSDSPPQQPVPAIQKSIYNRPDFMAVSSCSVYISMSSSLTALTWRRTRNSYCARSRMTIIPCPLGINPSLHFPCSCFKYLTTLKVQYRVIICCGLTLKKTHHLQSVSQQRDLNLLPD